MARSVQKISTLIHMRLTVYDSSNNGVTGLVNANFNKFLTMNGATNATVVTVTEIANGDYDVSFTPGSTGFWSLRITNATYQPRGWFEDFDVTNGGNDLAGGVVTLSSTEETTIANTLLDLPAAVDTFTFRQILRLMGSYGGGKSSGGALNDTVRAIDNSKDRITATLDGNGHRTSVTLNLT